MIKGLQKTNDKKGRYDEWHEIYRHWPNSEVWPDIHQKWPLSFKITVLDLLRSHHGIEILIYCDSQRLFNLKQCLSETELPFAAFFYIRVSHPFIHPTILLDHICQQASCKALQRMGETEKEFSEESSHFHLLYSQLRATGTERVGENVDVWVGKREMTGHFLWLPYYSALG